MKDKQGNFVHGLTAKDFVLTEDGTPQTIRYCEHQDLTETAKPLPVETPSTENVTIYNRLANTQIAPETMDNERYKNRRLLALYFDMTALPPADQMRALTAARAFRANADDDRRIWWRSCAITADRWTFCRIFQAIGTGC